MHCLPNRAVIRKDKQTTRFRIVYDVSARSNNGPSLNQILQAGSSLLLLINKIMLHFHTKLVALVRDLEKAFIMVAIEENHQNFWRFLWIDCLEAETLEIVIKHFCSLVLGHSARALFAECNTVSPCQEYEDLDSLFLKNFCQAFMLMTYLQEVISLQMLFSCF